MIKQNVFFSKMALYGDDIETLADYLKISRQTLKSKIECKTEFKRDEIDLIAIRYHLTPEEIHDIFFSQKEEA